MTRLARTDAMLADQHARLSAVIAGPYPPEARSLARHYLAKVEHWQGRPDAARDLALGEMGANGYGPAIDDVFAATAKPQPMLAMGVGQEEQTMEREAA